VYIKPRFFSNIGPRENYAAMASWPPPPPEASGVDGGIGGASSFVFSAIILPNPMLTPSMTARRMAHEMAPLRIDL
jgi:hypothetical protein